MEACWLSHPSWADSRTCTWWVAVTRTPLWPSQLGRCQPNGVTHTQRVLLRFVHVHGRCWVGGEQVSLASSPIQALQLLPATSQLLAISGQDAALLDIRRGLAKIAEAHAELPLTCCQADGASAALGTEAGQVRSADLPHDGQHTLWAHADSAEVQSSMFEGRWVQTCFCERRCCSGTCSQGPCNRAAYRRAHAL